MILFYYPYPNLNNLIILPNPELGNTEKLLGESLLKESLNGEIFTYIKRAKSEEYEFDLTFRMVTRDKMNEVMSWVRGYTGYFIRYHDWKDNIYKVQLVPNKIDFIMDKLTAPCIPARTESGTFKLSLRGVTGG